MKTIPFDITKLNDPNINVQTRDGRSVRVICTDRKNSLYNIVALIKDEAQEDVFTYAANGIWLCENSQRETKENKYITSRK